ncbi:glutathione transferase [Vogesella sp. EB]|uniref:glutathione S-transferase family protein n=1 Tax=Vogesella sp. EB TaxID=1526735 RepID=UPI00064D5799|nr:glutathione S-transferase family protein [Vogesella sp. EB]KMJ54391.1 glutathione transferase [Vogesella sp. EB]
MIILYGSALSPWYNKAKVALLEKGVNFEERLQRPSQDEAVLAASPIGKIPYVDINGFKLAESGAIVEWLEDAYPTLSLLPPSTNGRARARELALLIEHYLIAASAPLVRHALFGAPLSEQDKAEVAANLERGAAALARRMVPEGNWLCGDDFTVADIALAVALPHLGYLGSTLLGHDPLASLPLPPQYHERLAQRASVARMWHDREQALRKFLPH